MTSSKPSSSKAYFLAIRPKTLMAGISPVILGLALAYQVQGHLSITISLLTLTITLLLQMGTNLVNDAIDGLSGVDSHERQGPSRVTQLGWLTPQQVKYGYLFCFTLAFILGIALVLSAGGLIILAMGILAIAAAYLYSAGPYPLSHYALGELSALIFFGPYAVWGSFYLQTQSFDSWPLLWGLIPGLSAAAIMAINNLRDREQDLKAQKRTVATFISVQKAQKLPFIFVTIGVALNIILAFKTQNLLTLTALLAPILFTKHWIQLTTKAHGPELNQHLALTGVYLFVQTLLLSLGLIL